MVTASSLVSLVLGVPLGKLADRYGRKKLLFALAPVFVASNLLLVAADGPVALIASGVLLGVFPVTAVISAASRFRTLPSLSVVQTVPSARRKDAPALSSPPKP